jgi:hypothetical protein
MAKPEEI